MKVYFLLLIGLLSACGNLTERLSTIGEAPKLSQIQNPVQAAHYQPITMPMPKVIAEEKYHYGSLWKAGSKAFFKDQRAKKVGDIVTIIIDLDQKQAIEMTPKIEKKSESNTVVNNFLGFEKTIANAFPKKQKGEGGAANPSWFNFNSNPKFSGKAEYEVSDKMRFKIAASIIQILPNGNMVIQGRQEIRLLNEVREVDLKGIIRPEDITAQNTIIGDKVSELRIGYGGRGDLTEAQSAPWGHQVLNKISPF